METDTTREPRGFARFAQFPRPFWVINGIELIERGAYYSLSAVLTVALIALFQRDGMTQADATALATTLGAVLFLLLYLVPVVSAPFSEKFGYRAALGVVFTLLAAGYATLWFASGLGMAIASVVLIGLGAGIFKPIPAALVTQTSSETQRSFAFSIYYAFINIGALVFPGILGLVAASSGWRDENLVYHQVTFLAAAGLSAVNLLLVALVFRNLRPAQREKDVLASLATLGEVFRYPSFLVLMVIYAGFWFMYALVLTVLTAYMGQFDRMPDWFNVGILQTINPLVIILGAPLLAPLAQRFNPLALMITGILVYAAGLLAIGFSGLPALFLLGVVVYSTGELLTHPAYLAYVSRIAPPEKASVFLGYGFIPIGVGLFIGAKVGGDLYADIALRQGRPELYWAIMACIGLATAAALVLFNFFVGARKPAPASDAPRRRRLPVAPVVAVAIILLVPALVMAAREVPPTEGVGEGVEPLSATSLAVVALPPVAGTATEGEVFATSVTLPANATGDATVVLTWTDEAAQAPRTNQPDAFMVHVKDAAGNVVRESNETANDASGKGRIELTFPAAPGEYVIEVMVTPGDRVVAGPGPLGPLPVTQANEEDAGNAFELAVSHQAPAAA